jgi:hypothetical protein
MSQQISITELREQAMRSSRPIIADGHLITVVSGLEKRARYIGLQHPHRDKLDPEPADPVALWERDARHPGGEAYIAGDAPVKVACTERVAEKLRLYELLELLEVVEDES